MYIVLLVLYAFAIKTVPLACARPPSLLISKKCACVCVCVFRFMYMFGAVRFVCCFYI